MVAEIFNDADEFAAALPGPGPLVGLDLGTKTLGVALSDALRQIASPLQTIRRKRFGLDVERLFALVEGRGPRGLVIGLPANMDGSEGPRAQSTRAFARNLSQKTELPMLMWDERLSTVAVERTLIAADVSRAKRAEVVDKMAAAYILQGALDRLNFTFRSGNQWNDPWDDEEWP
ncbi:MAG: Holliday junction resolvase RuvX [Rhodobacteraceae bacterium]|nr:Holliday junction resolvase RuvX [Paracoccaceae bacterium]